MSRLPPLVGHTSSSATAKPDGLPAPPPSCHIKIPHQTHEKPRGFLTQPLCLRAQWAPGELRGVFATATFEGQLAISSLAACTAPGADGGGFSYGDSAASSAAAKAKAPAWLRRPCGASFGFGGRLAAFSNAKRQLPTGEVVEVGSVTIRQVGCRSKHRQALRAPAGVASTSKRQQPQRQQA